MTLREMYDDIGGDYNQVTARLGGAKGEVLLRKLIDMLPKDPSMAKLHTALEEKDYEAAFRAAHTYKGVVMNLGLTPLVDPVIELTDLLRDQRSAEQLIPLFHELEQWNQRVLEDISELTEE